MARRSVALLLAVIVSLAPATSAAAPTRAQLERAIDAWARPFLDAGHLSGQVLVTRGGQVLAERSWGLADRELGAPITPETRIGIASITKPMTIIVATRLIEEKKLAMSDTLGRFIPGFAAGDRITVEHLLRHRSGIPHRVTTEEDETQPITPAGLAEFAKKAAPLFEPGASGSYSSGGFTVLTRVLEVASGQGHEELFARHVYAPAGMTRTIHADSRMIVEGRAASYVPGLAGIDNAPLKDLSFLAGSGSLYSTARDVERLVQAVVSGKLGEGPRQSFVRGGKLSWNGSTNGYRAFADWDSASGLTVVFCGNVHTGAPDLLRGAIPKLVVGETAAPAALPALALRGAGAAAEDPALHELEGVYMLGNGTRLEVRARDGALSANEWILLPAADGSFFSLRDYGVVTVVRGVDGKVERFDWAVAGQPYPAPRIGDLP